MQTQNPASDNHQSHNDYVGAYQPPQQAQQTQPQAASPASASTPAVAPTPTASNYDPLAELEKLIKDSESAYKQTNQPTTTPAPVSDFDQREVAPSDEAPTTGAQDDFVDLAPTAQPAQPPQEQQAADTTVSNSLEKENIFFMLGAEGGSEEEKEKFLDELQQVIWEDFVQNDVELLLTESEYTDFKAIVAKGDINDPKIQEEMLVFLEKLVPDLEEIMLEKALELKEDLVLERIKGMEDYFVGNQEALDKIKSAKDLIDQDNWHQAGEILNSVA